MQLDVLYNEDCLLGMQRIPDGSVDCIISDLPYGTTNCKWDSIIPFAPLWEQYKRVAKKNAAIVLTGSQPFTTALISSNIHMFKYSWVWHKNAAGNPQLAKIQPLKCHEDILVFCQSGAAYYPQGIRASSSKTTSGKSSSLGHIRRVGNLRAKLTGYPRSVQSFKIERGLHPTQKPVALFEYLIRTYTNEGETVLDSCVGSGTTPIACMNAGRHYIGFEKDPGYFEMAQKRIADHKPQMPLTA
jgi:site-specific DNA-methyltransferase (adenine-specific)